MRTLLILSFMVLGILMVWGCSGSESLTTPPDQIKITGNQSFPNGMNDNQPLPIGISDRFSDGSIAGGQGVLGIFSVHIDTGSLTGEMIPLRQTSLEDVLEVVDITNFLQLAPCFDCIEIAGISIDADNHLVVSIGIRHPFPAGDPLKPVSGRNRGDLHVFNVEGIVVSDGTATDSFSEIGKTTGSVRLINADGYTGYLDSVLDDIYETEADLHPYVLHFDDYSEGNYNPSNPMGFESVTTPPPTGNLVMAMGSDFNYQDYIFDMPGESFDFIYAVGCTYPVAAASKIQRFSPEYRVPQHLKKAASEVKVEIISNLLMAGSPAGEAEIRVSVVDRSHGVPAGTNLDEMFAVSDVGSVIMEIPGILNSAIDEDTPLSGTGHDPSDPLIYDFTITNEASADEGIYTGLVKVLDTYAPGQNSSPLLNGMDGIARVDPITNPLTAMFDISEFATYQVFTIVVAFENNDPVVDAVEGCPRIIVGLPATYTVTANDPDLGQNLTYHWERGDTTPGQYDEAVTTIGEVELTYTLPGNYQLDVRVDDGAGGSGYSSDPLDITVYPQGMFVDADYTGGGSNGTLSQPFTNIQTAIDNGTSSGYVFVLPATNHYSQFAFSGTGRHIIGYDLDCGLDRPEVDVSMPHDCILSASNSSLENLIFNISINSAGGEAIRLKTSDSLTVRNCRFTGDSLGTSTAVLYLENLTNSIIENNEWVTFRLNAPASESRYAYMLRNSSGANVTIMHNEFHDIGIPTSATDGGWSGLYGIVCGYPTGNNIVVKNNLFYDFFDHSFAPDGGGIDQSNVLHAASVGNNDNFKFIHNTIDDFDVNDGYTLRNAWTVGIYCSMTPGLECNHNIFKSQHYYQGSLWIFHNSAGFWADTTDYINATYSCVFWGNPAPPGGPSQTFSYLNMMIKGTGSYDQNELVDPDFDYIPGPTYYHPQNTVVSHGAQDGGEMGCFGGPDGNWTPPSQIYN
jgi:hypothetical protein